MGINGIEATLHNNPWSPLWEGESYGNPFNAATEFMSLGSNVIANDDRISNEADEVVPISRQNKNSCQPQLGEWC